MKLQLVLVLFAATLGGCAVVPVGYPVGYRARVVVPAAVVIVPRHYYRY